MLSAKDVSVPLAERIDQLTQNTPVVLSVIGACFAVVLIACTVSRLGSDTRDRPR